MTRDALVRFEKNLYNDSKVSVGSQLAIEDFSYEMGEL
jgi:hypothetical protein